MSYQRVFGFFSFGGFEKLIQFPNLLTNNLTKTKKKQYVFFVGKIYVVHVLHQTDRCTMRGQFYIRGFVYWKVLWIAY